MITNWEEEFKYFLKENDWHINFMNNRDDNFFPTENPRYALEGAFDFTSAYEGVEFWGEVNNLWKEYYDYWVDADESDIYVLNSDDV